MIQTYDHLQKQTRAINEELSGTTFIQKIYSTSFLLCLSLRSTGKTRYLYIGRGSGIEGLWLGEEKPISFLRKRDAFLEYFRKHLSSTQFMKIEQDVNDRIVSLVYLKWGAENRLSLFYKGRKLYFSHHFISEKTKSMKLFRSWSPEVLDLAQLDYSLFDEIGRKELGGIDKSESEIKDIESILLEEERLAQQAPNVKKSKKFVKRKRQRIEEDLSRVANWASLQDFAMSGENFDQLDKKSVIKGIKLNFKESEHFKRRNEIFEKVKKLKKAEVILKERLENTKVETRRESEEENSLTPTRPFWNQKEKSNRGEPVKIESGSYRIYQFEGFQIGLGLSASGNDELRKNWAKKDDVWFHLESIKSPHIICKLNSSVLSEVVLRIIGSIMIEHSEHSFSEANLIHTAVKNLKGVKGAAGKVIFKKEKHITVQVLDDWKQYLVGI